MIICSPIQAGHHVIKLKSDNGNNGYDLFSVFFSPEINPAEYFRNEIYGANIGIEWRAGVKPDLYRIANTPNKPALTNTLDALHQKAEIDQ